MYYHLLTITAQTHCTGAGAEAGQGHGMGLGTMGLYITLCTVHTTQGQAHRTIVSYCASPVPCPCPSPGPVQCV